MSQPTGPDDPPERIAAYIDGFNFYHGLMAKGWGRFRWLDYRAMAQSLLLPGQTLVSVNYFTAEIQQPEDKRERQRTYLRALKIHGVDARRGQYRVEDCWCQQCGDYHRRLIEKQSDVALATSMVLDAADDLYDAAFLISADADQIPAVKLVRDRFEKRVIMWCPPRRTSDALAMHADNVLHFNRGHLSRNQLPNPVVTRKGRELWRPEEWS